MSALWSKPDCFSSSRVLRIKYSNLFCVGRTARFECSTEEDGCVSSDLRGDAARVFPCEGRRKLIKRFRNFCESVDKDSRCLRVDAGLDANDCVSVPSNMCCRELNRS